MPSDDNHIKVLFIAGQGRSGSTILHNLLGQVDGFEAVGELRELWERGVLKNQLCGCRQPFCECPMWREVFERAGEDMTAERAEELDAAIESFRLKDLPRTKVPVLRRRDLARLAPLLETLGNIYRSINEVTGCKVIVDSTKNPSFGYLLRHVPGLDVRFLHFVRDPPAVAYSWAQHKEFQPGVLMPRKSTLNSTLQWAARNGCTDLFLGPRDEVMRMRYEDFLIDPRSSVAEIVAWAGEGGAELPFTDSHTAVLDRVIHSVFGNEVRFANGPVTLRADNRWRQHMAPSEVRKVKTITWPLRRRYGYTADRPDSPVEVLP